MDRALNENDYASAELKVGGRGLVWLLIGSLLGREQVPLLFQGRKDWWVVVSWVLGWVPSLPHNKAENYGSVGGLV